MSHALTSGVPRVVEMPGVSDHRRIVEPSYPAVLGVVGVAGELDRGLGVSHRALPPTEGPFDIREREERELRRVGRSLLLGCDHTALEQRQRTPRLVQSDMAHSPRLGRPVVY